MYCNHFDRPRKGFSGITLQTWTDMEKAQNISKKRQWSIAQKFLWNRPRGSTKRRKIFFSGRSKNTTRTLTMHGLRLSLKRQTWIGVSVMTGVKHIQISMHGILQAPKSNFCEEEVGWGACIQRTAQMPQFLATGVISGASQHPKDVPFVNLREFFNDECTVWALQSVEDSVNCTMSLVSLLTFLNVTRQRPSLASNCPKPPHFLHCASSSISLQSVQLETSNLMERLILRSHCLWRTNHPWKLEHV